MPPQRQKSEGRPRGAVALSGAISRGSIRLLGRGGCRRLLEPEQLGAVAWFGGPDDAVSMPAMAASRRNYGQNAYMPAAQAIENLTQGIHCPQSSTVTETVVQCIVADKWRLREFSSGRFCSNPVNPVNPVH